MSGLLLTVTNGAGPQHDANEKDYLVATNNKVAYWQTAANGFVRAANQMKGKAEVVGPDTYDPKAEQQEFQRVAKLKPAGTLVSVARAKLLHRHIEAAHESGAPGMTVAARAPHST